MDLQGREIRIVEMGSLSDMTEEVAMMSGSCAFRATLELLVVDDKRKHYGTYSLGELALWKFYFQIA